MREGCLRILFLIQGLTVAASRYRVLQYLPFLESSGIETEVAPFPSSPGGWLRLRGGLGKAGIIFVQRKRLPLFVLLFLKRLGKTIVYDFDDAVMFRNSLSPNPSP